MTENYGKRKDDIMLPDIDDFAKNLTDSQKMNLKLMQNVSSVNTALNNLQSDFRDMVAEVEIHDKLLVTGNGVPSLQERIRKMEAFIEGQKYWLRFVAGALIVQVIAFIVVAATFIIRFAPLLERIEHELP